jgi:hypothetical protein
MAKRTVMLEFNELTPALMDRFIAQGHLPGFARLRDQSIVCVSDAEEPPPALEPWIQWVTVHTGLTYGEHNVFNLGDGVKSTAPRLWDHFADAGRRAWVCGSMNTAINTRHPENVFLLPDPWSKGVKPHPSDLFDDFFRLVQGYVQEYTSDKVPLGKADYARFMRFMVSRGLSVKSVSDAAAQLIGERTGRPRWKRAVILDRLQWDVFRHFYKRLSPDFSTFFLNSTAHFQHYYWRNMEPEVFAHRDTPERQAAYADAILYGYRKMDAIVSECLDLVGPDVNVVFCTALGQQPLTKYDEQGGKQVYRARDITMLLKAVGITSNPKYSPVMAEEFFLTFASEEEAVDGERRLRSLTDPDGAPVVRTNRDGRDVFAGCAVIRSVDEDMVVRTPQSNRDLRFEELFYPLDGVKSGGHHPDGILWFRLPGAAPTVVSRKVSIREIAPTVLALSGLPGADGYALPPMPEVLDAVRAGSTAPERSAA